MKRFGILFLVLAVLLTACAAPTPGATVAPGSTTDPLVESVTETPAPPDVSVPEMTATTTQAAGVGGGAIFTDLVRSSDSFSLKCSPTEIIFGVKSLNSAVASVIFFYRVIDKSSAAAAGAMVESKVMTAGDNGHFTLPFNALNLKEDLRFSNGWFEYQFVGLSKAGSVVGRSDKIVKQVTFTVACP